ncbi:MAG: hypothetical protein ACR2MO_09890 [Acidimicrobiales bacterium]
MRRRGGKRAVVAALALTLVAACSDSGSSPPPRTTLAPQPAGPGSIRLAIWGDTPYSGDELAEIPRLVQEINDAQVDFSVMLGDLGGAGACDDIAYDNALATFNFFDAPLVYVPGDNEWTDCHERGHDPIERLARLRQVMYVTPESLGQRRIPLEQQSAERPEHVRWFDREVLFVGINVPGSNNNHIQDLTGGGPQDPRTPAQLAAADAEYQARDAAVREWLHSSFEAAAAADAAGVVIAMQADPAFEVAPDERAVDGVDGFDRLLDAFRDEAKRFARPVVILHGDSHVYRFDVPLLDKEMGEPLAGVSRVESFGSPDVGWVEVTINPGGRRFVTAIPHLVTAGTR